MEEKKKPRSDLEDDYKPTILFTAGTALVALCLKRALVTVFLAKQWHVYVFLVLNLVLLAIMFTSMSSSMTTPYKTQQAKSEDDEVVKKEKRKRKIHQKRAVVVDRHVHQACNNHKFIKAMQSDIKEVVVSSSSGDEKEEGNIVKVSEGKGAEVEEEMMSGLSDEELNERVESFIATFRQHLILDARNI